MKMNRQISRGGKYSKEHGKNTQMNDKKKRRLQFTGVDLMKEAARKAAGGVGGSCEVNIKRQIEEWKRNSQAT